MSGSAPTAATTAHKMKVAAALVVPALVAAAVALSFFFVDDPLVDSPYPILHAFVVTSAVLTTFNWGHRTQKYAAFALWISWLTALSAQEILGDRHSAWFFACLDFILVIFFRQLSRQVREWWIVAITTLHVFMLMFDLIFLVTMEVRGERSDTYLIALEILFLSSCVILIYRSLMDPIHAQFRRFAEFAYGAQLEHSDDDTPAAAQNGD